MSLHGNFDLSGPPTELDYAAQAQIPDDERCPHCQGLRVARLQFSSCFGGDTSHDWVKCGVCKGTGRKPDVTS